MQVKDLKIGDNIEVIELVVKSVGQGKLGKPPGNTPYQHAWLTDGTGDIRFSLFGEDVNKLQEGQRIKVISGYIKEYPAGSGKLQLALGKDGGAWQIISGQGTVTRSDDIVPAPVQIVNSDDIQTYIIKQTCLKAAATLYANNLGINEIDTAQFLKQTQMMYEWVMAEELLSEKPPEPEGAESAGETPKVQSSMGPQATKLRLIADAAIKEKAGWTGPPTTDLVQKFAAVMNGILGGDKERHTWLKWTYGVESGSSKDVTGAKLQVVWEMLKPTYTDKRWIPTNKEAAEAIKAMFKQALIDAGQMTFEQSVEELYGPD